MIPIQRDFDLFAQDLHRMVGLPVGGEQDSVKVSDWTSVSPIVRAFAILYVEAQTGSTFPFDLVGSISSWEDLHYFAQVRSEHEDGNG